MHHATSQI